MSLEARDVTVRRGGREVLVDVSLETVRGAVTGVLGPNGAGKSSLLLAMLGALPEGLERGEVTLEGRPLPSWTADERAQRVAYVPQSTELTAPLTVRSVVAMGRRARRGWAPWSTPRGDGAVDEAMERTDVAGLAERRFDALSGGEQRRVLLARALATEARVVLLDEPAASLDVGHGLALYARLRELAVDDYALLVVMHDLDDALRFTDRAIMLDGGRVVAAGPTEEVITSERIGKVYGVHMHADAGLRFSRGDV